MARTADSNVGVKTLLNRTIFEIRDMDEWTNEEEIIAAVTASSGAQRETLRVFSLKKQYGGVQVALVSAPADVSKIVEGQHLRLGIVSCRVRSYEAKTRCFRCMSYGHIARECKGPDKSKECRRCGIEKHFA